MNSTCFCFSFQARYPVVTNSNRKQNFLSSFVIVQNPFKGFRFGSPSRTTQRTQRTSSEVNTEFHPFEKISSFWKKLNKVGKLLNGIQCVYHRQYLLWTVLRSQVQRMTKAVNKNCIGTFRCYSCLNSRQATFHIAGLIVSLPSAIVQVKS